MTWISASGVVDVLASAGKYFLIHSDYFFSATRIFADAFVNMMGDSQSRYLQPKKNPITDDYKLTNNVLGLGINGKVVECQSKSTGAKFALKVGVSQFNPNVM